MYIYFTQMEMLQKIYIKHHNVLAKSTYKGEVKEVYKNKLALIKSKTSVGTSAPRTEMG